MDCEQSGRAIEELLNEGDGPAQAPAFEEHLAACPECRARYEREARLVQALGELETVPASPDFAAWVLEQLPDVAPDASAPLEWQAPLEVAPTVPEWVVASEAPQAAASPRDRLRAAWDSFRAGLSGPARSRRLIPALVGAAVLLLVAALGFGLLTGGMQTTPGAAVGPSPWLAGGAVLLVAAALVVGLILRRRR